MRGFLNFYWEIIKAAPKAAWDALSIVSALIAAAAILLLVAGGAKAADDLDSWRTIPSLAVAALVLAFFVFGLLRATYNRFKGIETALSDAEANPVRTEAIPTRSSDRKTLAQLAQNFGLPDHWFAAAAKDENPLTAEVFDLTTGWHEFLASRGGKLPADFVARRLTNHAIIEYVTSGQMPFGVAADKAAEYKVFVQAIEEERRSRFPASSVSTVGMFPLNGELPQSLRPPES